jgi:radical SAM protein with 4Fe4S-binding SPASM domain
VYFVNACVKIGLCGMMKYSVGIGLTNRCNLNCPHCYSQGQCKTDMSKDTVKDLIDNVKISSINLGTGENGLHPKFKEIISMINEKKLKMSLTSNGLSVGLLNDEELAYFNDIDISIDFASETKHNKFRGKKIYSKAIDAIKRCNDLNIPVSITTAMMSINYMEPTKLLDLCSKFDCNLRVNVYKPVETRNFSLTYLQFWKGVGSLFENSRIVSCSEPIINTIINPKNTLGCPCGANSLRIRPNGDVIPCVYWNKSDVSINNLIKNGPGVLNKSCEFAKIREIPSECEDCEFVAVCEGGCASRRLYSDFNKRDQYCYLKKHKKPNFDFEFGKSKDLVHSNYLCTMIVEPR